MTNSTTYFVSLISLCFLVIMVFWLYRDYRVDKFRQKLFKLRDSLFDDAAAGKIPFDTNAYGMLRNTMNGSIRFGHRLNLSQMLLFILLTESGSKGAESSYSVRLRKALECLSDEQKALAQDYHEKMNFIVIEHMVFSSPLLLISLIIPVAFLLEAKKHVSAVISPFKSPLDKFDDAALLLGR